MSDSAPPDETVDVPVPDAVLEAGLMAAFGAGSASRPSAGRSVLQDLSSVLQSVPHVHLRDPESGPGSPIVRTRSGEMPTGRDPAARYQLFGEIARGGMGAILKGRDADLGRDIAIKVLLETHQGKPDLLQRFIEEAQIAGQLQHPGVVPVYELGQFGDCRPYFAMKLVKGQTLSKLLEGRTDHGDNRIPLLKTFEQVCQTMAYAHSRGVIHRDLKPSNVMVGAFGEVQVMDWGLAKVLPEGGIADEARTQIRQEISVIRTRRTEGSDLPGSGGTETQAGSVLGTPAYMAPEQARGEVELVDERADVFGLGAILCEILTGKPAFTGKNAEAQRKSQTAKLEDAYDRLEACGVDAELIALAKQCLAAEPWDRPRHAGAVANTIAGYQGSVADRLRHAEVERAGAEFRAQEERKRRRITVGLAATLLILALATGSVGVWWWQERGDVTRDVESALAEAGAHEKAGRWPEARAALERASGRMVGRGLESLRRRVAEAQRDAKMVAELEEIKLQESESDINGGDFDSLETAEKFAAAFARYGISGPESSQQETARRIRESPIGENLIVALDDWRRRRNRLGIALKPTANGWMLQSVDPVDPIAAETGKVRIGDLVLGIGQGSDGPLVDIRGKSWPQVSRLLPGKQGSVFRIQVKPAGPGDPRICLLTRGDALGTWLEAVVEAADDNSWRRRIREAEWARDVEKMTFLARQPDASEQSPGSIYWLGLTLKSEELKEEAWKLLSRAQQRYPADFWLNHSLAGIWDNDSRGLAHRDEALGYSRVAVALRPTAAAAHNRLAIALMDKQAMDEAIEELRFALKLNPNHRPLHVNLGNALLGTDKVAEAIGEYREALKIHLNDGTTRYNLGIALGLKGELISAIAEYREAIRLDPTHANWFDALGASLSQTGAYDEAIAAHRRALEIDPKYTNADFHLFDTLVKKGDAVAEYQRAIKLDPKSALAYKNLGRALWKSGDLDGGIAATRKAIELDPTLADAHNYLGNCLGEKGDTDGAIAEYRVALRYQPNDSKLHTNLGKAFADKADFEAAKVETEIALRLDPKNDTAKTNLQTIEYNQALDRMLPAVLSGKTKPTPDDRIRLGLFCCSPGKKLYVTGARLFADALEAKPGLADDLPSENRYQAACAAAMAGCKSGKEVPPPDEQTRTGWRNRALVWLRADLVAYSKLVASGKPNDIAFVKERLTQGLKDDDLAGVRGKTALPNLSSKEQEDWKKYWADVEALLQKLKDKPVNSERSKN